MLEPQENDEITFKEDAFDIGYEEKMTPVLAIPEKPVPNRTRVG